MAQRIEVPGAGILEFPDDMTDEQMAAAIQSNFPDLHKPAAAPQSQAEQPERTTGQQIARQLGLATRYGVEGLAGLPLIAGNAANALVNLGIRGVNRAAGTEIPQLNSASQAFQGLLGDIGLPQPETRRERLISDAARAMAGAGGSVATGRLVQEVPGLLGKVGGILTTKPGMQALSAASGGASAGYAREEGGGPLAQIGAGLAGGIAAPFAADVVAQSLKGAARAIPAAIKPFTAAGKEEIAGRTLGKLAFDRTRAAERLRDVDEIVPGSQPTTAQASRDYGLLTAERGIASSSPQAGARFAERFAAQNKARETLLGGMAKDKAAIETAKSVRDELSLPLLEEARRTAKPVNIAPIASRIDDILSSEAGERDIVTQALNSVKKKLYDPNGAPKTDLTRLYGIRKHINDMLDSRLSGEAGNARLASRELIKVRDTIDDQLGEAAPQFKDYLRLYKEGSKPVNQMETLQDVATRITNAGTTATGENILSQAKWYNVVTKHRDELSKVLKPDQMKNLERIGQDLDMGALSVTGGKAAGSNTFQNLSTANMLGSMVGGKMPDSSLFQTLTRPLAWVYKVPDEQIRELLVDAMLDPKMASRLMMKSTPGNVTSLSNALKQRAAALGLGTAQALRVQSTPLQQEQQNRQR